MKSIFLGVIILFSFLYFCRNVFSSEVPSVYSANGCTCNSMSKYNFVECRCDFLSIFSGGKFCTTLGADVIDKEGKSIRYTYDSSSGCLLVGKNGKLTVFDRNGVEYQIDSEKGYDKKMKKICGNPC